QRSYPARIGPGSPQLREHAVGLEEAAVDANGALERGLGTGEVAENPQRRAEVVLEIRPPRRERRRTPERARRLPMRTAPGEHDADGVERERIARLERDGPLGRDPGLPVPSQHREAARV